MKKFILSLAIAAFIGGGSVAFATVSNQADKGVEISQIMQDGQKKSTATKKDGEVKKEECKDASAKKDCGTKSDCKGNDVLKKKSCCSDGKTDKAKTTNPEKK